MPTVESKPILFSPQNAKAVFEGRKTHTRRITGVMKKVNSIDYLHGFHKISYNKKKQHLLLYYSDYEGDIFEYRPCEYGKVGDVLWVRETWSKYKGSVLYRAGVVHFGLPHIKWKPSIYMPRKYARLFLSIVSIKVEKIQSITKKDCFKEGIQIPFSPGNLPCIRVTGKYPPSDYLKKHGLNMMRQ